MQITAPDISEPGTRPSETGTAADEGGNQDLLTQALASRTGERWARGPDIPAPQTIISGLRMLDAAAPEQSVRTGDLVQICGPSGVGKTQVLFALVAAAIAPPPAGRGSRVCYFELGPCVDRGRIQALVKRLCEKAAEGTGSDDRVPTNEEQTKLIEHAMGRLSVYRANDTKTLYVTLHSLQAFFCTREGSFVDMIAIDGLGVHHYTDIYEGRESGTGSAEDVLVSIVRQLLRTRRVFVAVTECALFEDVRLGVAASKGMPDEHVPGKPAEFMPRTWLDLISHSLVLYFAAQNGDDLEENCPRGLIAVHYPKNAKKERSVMIAAAALHVDDDGVKVVGQGVLSASER